MEANVQGKGPAPAAAQFNKVGKPKSQKPKAPAKAVWTEWLVPAGLIVLSLIPVIAGAVRITELTGGAEVTPANARFFASPLPVVLHILSASLYSILGAFQFVPSLRRRRRSWHRAAGWLLIPCGLAAGLSGLWMTLFYPWPDGDGELLYGLRLLFGSAMVLSIILGVVAIRRRDFVGHGAWMMRGYAIGLGAGTQVLTHLPWFLILGTPDEFPRALLMGAGWVINLAVAEWIIRKQPARPARPASAVVSPLR
ncbi:MAG: membrane protein [Chloroflexota bacterium]|nr:MAG: membrane protein [Chloroflexota bacterium]